MTDPSEKKKHSPTQTRRQSPLTRQLLSVPMKMALLGVFLIALLAIGQEPSRPSPEWKWSNVPDLMARLQKESPNLVLHLFAESENCTINLLAPKDLIPAHYHLHHEEIVYIVRGSGKMRVNKDEFIVQAGDVLFLPKKTVHSFEPTSTDVLALSIFVPKFDGKDRIFGETPPP